MVLHRLPGGLWSCPLWGSNAEVRELQNDHLLLQSLPERRLARG